MGQLIFPASVSQSPLATYVDLPAVTDELPDAVEAHGEAHPTEEAAAQRQDDDDVVRVDVELEVVQHLPRKGTVIFP